MTEEKYPQKYSYKEVARHHEFFKDEHPDDGEESVYNHVYGINPRMHSRLKSLGLHFDQDKKEAIVKHKDAINNVKEFHKKLNADKTGVGPNSLNHYGVRWRGSDDYDDQVLFPNDLTKAVEKAQKYRGKK